MARIIVVYDTKYGNTKLAGEIILEGIREVEDVEVSICSSKKSTLEKWLGFLKMHETETLYDASYSVQENRNDRVVAAIRRVLERMQGLG